MRAVAPRTRGPAELLQVQAGQLRRQPPGLGPLGRLHAAQQGDPVALGGPARSTGPARDHPRGWRLMFGRKGLTQRMFMLRDRGPYLL